ncbi:MAG: N-acetylmuramoyl-L-alanine amidase [Clostridiales bacterium]|nr:N-acetylmuramoyl-L-alanine amidase [Clostridiales bacterium]
MKKKATAMRLAAVSAGLIVAVTGCQAKKYEKVDVGAIREESRQSQAELEDRETLTVSTSNVIIQGEGQTAAWQENHPTDIIWGDCNDVVYVNADRLNLRKTAGTDGEILSVVEMGEELTRTGVDPAGEWTQLEYHGGVAYAASRYLSEMKPEIPETAAETENTGISADSGQSSEIGLNSSWIYAGYSKINSGRAVRYRADESVRNGKVVCVNAGHGTSGGSSVKTQCHPDGSAKVTGGTTQAGATTAVAVSGGMAFADGTAESKVTLALALKLKALLLSRGYDVVMIRESDDVQLDNIARTVIANNTSDCHLALHWDSTESDKGAFYLSVPSDSTYRAMEPVASHWQEHHALGDSLIAGLKGAGVKIFSGGSMEMDLTQTSYSTIPSVDIELGDKASDHSSSTLDQLAQGLADGVDAFFGL